MNSRSAISPAAIAALFAAALAMIAAPGSRWAEATATHYGKMLWHRHEGRQ